MPENSPRPTLLDGMKRLLTWLEPVAQPSRSENQQYVNATVLHLDGESADLFVGSTLDYDALAIAATAAESLDNAGITVEQFERADHALITVTGAITAIGHPDFAIVLETNIHNGFARSLVASLGEPKAPDETLWITSPAHLRSFLAQGAVSA